MAGRDSSQDPTAEASPLDVLPGLAAVAGTMADAVIVTDLHRRVVIWNAAADRLYGVPDSEALGTPIDLLYDSTIIGEGTSSAGARTLALSTGTWRGRVVDVPRVGRLVGQELFIETVLSRIDGPDGQAIGVISIKRDVTPSVRVEQELTTVMSLGSATGESRTRQGAAGQALDMLVATTGAKLAAIAVPTAEGNIGFLAHRGASPETIQVIASVPWARSPAVKAVMPVGRVVKGPVALVPFEPATRRAILDAGIRTIVFVGLHRDGDLVGVLSLGWDRDDPVIPSDAVILLAAGHITRGLENARLVEEIVRRAENERQLTHRLRALEELTRIGGSVTTLQELAERSARLINTALGASGTAYGLLAPDGESYAVSHMADVRPAIAAWLLVANPDQRTAFKRWRAGEGSFLEAFAPGRVTAESLALAREAGVTAYAAIPIRVDDEVIGGIAAYFDRPVDDLHVDRNALDRIATVASISMANFRLRERLEAAEQRSRSIFEASPDAICISTGDGLVVDANDAALRLYRSDSSWLVGRRATDLAQLDLEPIRERADALGQGQTLRLRVIGVRQDATSFPAEIEVAAVEIDGGRRYLVRVRDLTEQERLQTELVQAQKMEAIGQLVSGVAHELNNPLAAIILSSQLIRRDPALPEDLRHNADLLVEEATRTKRIVQNLLDFAKQRAPERYPTSIRDLVDSVLALQSYSLGRGSIETKVEVPSDLPAVELDRAQFQQVLVNLTHNAIYAIRHGGGTTLRITASTEGPADAPRVRVTVMDDGPGVAPEHVEHLFEAFFTTKPPADGTGLGLPVSYGIVASHGGDLRYGPSPMGRGAAFTFDLPVHAVRSDDVVVPIPRVTVPPASGAATPRIPGPDVAVVAPASPEQSHAADATDTPTTRRRAADRRRVLVLDDESSIRIFLGKALLALGYAPVVAATGEEAIEHTRRGPFMAVLCDHQMPGMSGVEVYEAIVARHPELGSRFIMMSGDVLNPALETFISRHDVTILSKPFDLETLDRTVASVGGAPTGD
ncbi:MAG: ATP-binding protein [Candidatus Limnocylindrales bacterium]